MSFAASRIHYALISSGSLLIDILRPKFAGAGGGSMTCDAPARRPNGSEAKLRGPSRVPAADRHGGCSSRAVLARRESDVSRRAAGHVIIAAGASAPDRSPAATASA